MAEQNNNRNLLVLVGLGVATMLTFGIIYFVDGSQSASEEPSQMVAELTGEIRDLESSLLDIEMAYSFKDESLDQAKELLEAKNARLQALSEEIDELERKGELDEATIRRLREEIKKARAKVVTVRDKTDNVNTLVKDMASITRNYDSLYLEWKYIDSLYQVSQVMIDEYKNNCNCGGQINIRAQPSTETVPRLRVENFKIYNETPDGQQALVDGEIKIDNIERLKFCFDLKGNQLVESGNKRLYLVLHKAAGRGLADVVSNKSSGSGTFELNGRKQAYTKANDATYRKGESLDICIDYQQAKEQYLFGGYKASIYYDGELIESKRINML